MKTIKQIADELGVSKEAIRKQVPTLPPTCVTTGANRAILINPIGEGLLKERVTTKVPTWHQLGTNQCQPVGTTSDDISAVIQELREQLAVKDKQIESLQQSLNDTTKSLSDTTKALNDVTQSLNASQALHAGTIQQQLAPPDEQASEPASQPEVPTEPQQKRGLWRIFGKR